MSSSTNSSDGVALEARGISLISFQEDMKSIKSHISKFLTTWGREKASSKSWRTEKVKNGSNGKRMAYKSQETIKIKRWSLELISPIDLVTTNWTATLIPAKINAFKQKYLSTFEVHLTKSFISFLFKEKEKLWKDLFLIDLKRKERVEKNLLFGFVARPILQ